jgi:hypothetical protein
MAPLEKCSSGIIMQRLCHLCSQPQAINHRIRINLADIYSNLEKLLANPVEKGKMPEEKFSYEQD